MKKNILTFFLAMLFSGPVFAQSCETSINGHSVCDFDVTDFYGLPSPPAVSPPSAGRIYFDIGDAKLKCSEDGGAYTDCVGGGSGSGDIEEVGDCSTGACFTGSSGASLIFNNAGGDGTLSYDTDFNFDKDVSIGSGTFMTPTPGTDLYVTNNLEVDGNIYGAANVGIGDFTPDAQLEIAELGTIPFMISNGEAGNGNFFIVNSVGNVGIGTTIPITKFQTVTQIVVGSPTTLDAETLVLSGGAQLGAIRFRTDASGGSTAMGRATASFVGTQATEFGFRAQGAIYLGTSSTPTITATGGNLGIGTITPTSNIHLKVSSPSSNQVIFNLETTDDSSRVSVDEDGDMLIDGSVGIGTTAVPTGKLQISGGNVGIGTSAPEFPFAVRTAGPLMSKKSGANTACTTTCGTAGCYFGQDDTTKDDVDCADASADICFCAGN